MPTLSHDYRAKMAAWPDQFPPTEGENKWSAVS